MFLAYFTLPSRDCGSQPASSMSVMIALRESDGRVAKTPVPRSFSYWADMPERDSANVAVVPGHLVAIATACMRNDTGNAASAIGALTLQTAARRGINRQEATWSAQPKSLL